MNLSITDRKLVHTTGRTKLVPHTYAIPKKKCFLQVPSNRRTNANAHETIFLFVKNPV